MKSKQIWIALGLLGLLGLGMASCSPIIYAIKAHQNNPNGNPVSVHPAGAPQVKLLVPSHYLNPEATRDEKQPLVIHYGFPSMDSYALAKWRPWWRKSHLFENTRFEKEEFHLGAYLYAASTPPPDRIVKQVLAQSAARYEIVQKYDTRRGTFTPASVGLTTYRFKPPYPVIPDTMREWHGNRESAATRWEFIHQPMDRPDLFIQCHDTHSGMGLFPSCEVVTNMLINGVNIDLRYTMEDYLIPYWREYDRRLRDLVTSFARI
jgi:hypothetical protein